MNKRLQFSDREALEVLSTGEVELAKVAFKQLYDQHFTIIYRVALRLLDSPELATEMSAELFTTLWIKRADLIGVKNFEGYIRTSAKNLVREFLKKQIKSEAASGEHISQMEIKADTIITKFYN